MCRIVDFRILRNVYFDFFFNVQNWDSQQDRDSCLKINKYYVIFENSTIWHIPNSFFYVKPGTLMLKMNPSNNINIIIFFLSGFSYFFWIGNMFDEKHLKKGSPFEKLKVSKSCLNELKFCEFRYSAPITTLRIWDEPEISLFHF